MNICLTDNRCLIIRLLNILKNQKYYYLYIKHNKTFQINLLSVETIINYADGWLEDSLARRIKRSSGRF